MSETLYQVWRDTSYIYTATTSGLNIFDVESMNKVAYIYNDSGFTTIWGNTTTIYLGTIDEGVKYLEKDAIVDGDLSLALQDYIYFGSTSMSIRYIHGYNDVVSIVTTSGLDVVKSGAYGFKSSVSGTEFTRCFMTSKNELYYVVQGATTSGLCRVDAVLWDWSVPDMFYTPGLSFLPVSQEVNDIFVTEATSVNGGANTLFVATTSGVYVLDEGVSEFDTYYSK